MNSAFKIRCGSVPPVAIVTVAATEGSAPREAGAKMIVYSEEEIEGTVGGGKFEALVIRDALAATRVELKRYPLREGDPDSFGAICGGTVTVLIEPQTRGEALVIVGGGHCAQAIARLGSECGMRVTVLDDREELVDPGHFPTAAHRLSEISAPDFIRSRVWSERDALVIVSRNHLLDEEALFAALGQTGIGYLGMIGSRRKVLRVFDRLRARGQTGEGLSRVHAPIGLDISADSPAQIAVSVLAEVMMILRGGTGASLRKLREH